MTTTTPATLPTYDRFIEPLLRFLAGMPEGAPAREAAADALVLNELTQLGFFMQAA